MEMNIMASIIMGLIVIAIIIFIVARSDIKVWEKNVTEYVQEKQLVKLKNKPAVTLTCTEDNDEYNYAIDIDEFMLKNTENVDNIMLGAKFKGQERFFGPFAVGEEIDLDKYHISKSTLEPQKKEILVLSVWNNTDCIGDYKTYGTKGLLAECEEDFSGTAVLNTTCS